MQKIQHARNRDQRGCAFLLDGTNDFGGVARRFEYNCGSEQRRNKQRQELAENVAQRNEGDKTQRVEPVLIFSILFDAAFQRLKVCQKIAVRQNNAARLGRRARSIKNFRNGASRGSIAGIDAGI